MKNMFFSALLLLIFTSMAVGAEFSADMITHTPMGKESGKIYHKNSDISRTEIMGMTNIMKYPQVYQLVDETKKYVVTDLDELSKEHPATGIRDFDQFVKENNFRKSGTENLQGYRCEIYEGEVKFSSEAGHDSMSIFMKLWYSRELDYPLKTESTLPPPMGGKVVSYLENITRGKQPDSLFEIPPDYTRVQSIQEAMGMPDIPSIGEMPSPEQMEDMMEMMQKMMDQLSPQ